MLSYIVLVILAAILQLTFGCIGLMYVRIYGGTKYTVYLYQRTHVIDGKEYYYYAESANDGILAWMLPKQFLMLPKCAYGTSEKLAQDTQVNYIHNMVSSFNYRRAKLDKPLLEDVNIRFVVRKK